MAREGWTDERLDDLNQKVDAGFKETRDEFKGVREEFKGVRDEFKGVREEFKGVRAEIGEVRSEVNALARAVIQLGFGLVGAMLVGFLGIMATLIVKL